jgi:RNA polymerase sigma-70 factor (ECF subfamily)
MSQAFEAVVTAHHDEIYRYLRRAVGPAGDAEDLCQETFLRGYRAYATLPQDANVRAWLFSIATNLAKNYFRAETRRRRAYSEVRVSGQEAMDGRPEAELV